MRILRIYPFLPPSPGGMERHVQRLSEEQRAQGHSVTVAYSQGNSVSGHDIVVLRWMNLRKCRPQVLRDLLFYFTLFWRLRNHRGEYDIVHVHGDWSGFLLAKALGKFLGAGALIASVHGVLRHRQIYRRALAGYDWVYTTGRSQATLLKSLLDIPVDWQPSGVDCQDAGAKSLTKMPFDVVSVSSLVKVKNVALILDIAEKLPNFHFAILGDGPLLNTLEKSRDLRCLYNVTFRGHVPAAEVMKTLASSRVFLLVSFEEGTPTAVLEAFAAGLPVVSSSSNDYSGLIIQGENGYVIDGFEPESYCHAIRQILCNDTDRVTMGLRNRERSAEFAWPQVASSISARMAQYAH